MPWARRWYLWGLWRHDRDLYALAGLVDWRIAGFFVAGGLAGGFAGVAVAGRLAKQRGLLTRVFAVAVLAVAGLTLWRTGAQVFG